jgi:hypothetical protein
VVTGVTDARDDDDVALEDFDDEAVAAVLADDGTVAADVAAVIVALDAVNDVACWATYGIAAPSAAAATPVAAARLRQLRCQRFLVAGDRIGMAISMPAVGKSDVRRP